jgi:hypothetical protein
LSLAVVLNGCATRQLAPAPPERAAAAWAAFADYCADRSAQAGPYRLQCGLRYAGMDGDGNRANAVLWGNNDRLVRLDVMASMGTLVGRVLQNDDHLVIHSPRENKAWTYQGRAKALLSFGMPIPLAIQDVAAVMQGLFLDVLGPAEGRDPRVEEQDPEGAIEFRLEGGLLPGVITLNPDGLLVRWQESPRAWSMDIEYDKGVPPLPREITIDHPQGRRAVLTVTARQRLAAPFGRDQLRLDLPPGTAIEPMRQTER